MDSNLMKDVKDIITILTPIAIAWIGYLQIKAGKKQNEIAIKVDGMTSKLVEAEKAASNAQGQLQAKADAKAEMIIPIPVVIPSTDVKVSLKEEVVKKVAETVVETVKADPAIEVKKVDGT